MSNDARHETGIQRGMHSEKLGRRVTAHPCDCGSATRHTVLGEQTLKCDVCGVVKLGV